MNITALAENTAGSSGCGYEHGLSLYIETSRHRLLFDTGASDLFLRNAERLQIDLSRIDTVVLSHGHYDHGGGLPYFLQMNRTARIFIPPHAFGAYYSMHKDGPVYIGLPRELQNNPRLVTADTVMTIDEELRLFSGIPSRWPAPSANRRLKEQAGDILIPDLFSHEQCLAVTENGFTVLFSGCAHHGMRNILDRFQQLYQNAPDAAVSGFHLKQSVYSPEELQQIKETAAALKQYSKTRFITCHCTGEFAYEQMKKQMNGQLGYLHSGDTVVLP